jgi:hypothetical protein
MPDFTPALPKPAKWAVNDNRFNENGKNPKTLSVFIPLDSVPAFANHLMSLADDKNKHKEGDTFNYSTMSKEKCVGVYLNCNGREGDYGAFGNINPAQIKQELPY